MSAFKPVFRLNPRFRTAWRESMKELLTLLDKRDPESIQKLVSQSGGRFVKNVASITPPASGSLDSQAKLKGEQAILDDLLKIAVPVTVVGSARGIRDTLASAEDLLALHQRSRSGAAGRVNPRSLKEKLFLSQADFNRTLSTLQKRVGWLAAGLNAAAARLGISLPAWIKRHGDRFGKIEVVFTDTRALIRVTQNVPYADDVKDYERHFNFALQKEANTLKAQIKAIWSKKTKKAKSHFHK